jgi:hypothetical protein
VDSGFQVLVRISYFSASVKEELLFTKLNISLGLFPWGLFPWVLSCIVISGGIAAGVFTASLSLAELVEGNIFTDEATCWFFGSNTSKLSCFVLVATALLSHFVS